MAQSQISRVLRGATERERVAAILSQERFGSRRAFGRRICREFSFVDAAGWLQVSGCLKALSTLAGEDPGIVLPPPAAEAVDRTPRLLPSGVEEPSGVPPHPSQIRGLEIAAAASAKAVFMRPLDPGWRRRLGVPPVEHAPALEPGEGLSAYQ